MRAIHDVPPTLLSATQPALLPLLPQINPLPIYDHQPGKHLANTTYQLIVTLLPLLPAIALNPNLLKTIFIGYFLQFSIEIIDEITLKAEQPEISELLDAI